MQLSSCSTSELSEYLLTQRGENRFYYQVKKKSIFKQTNPCATPRFQLQQDNLIIHKKSLEKVTVCKKICFMKLEMQSNIDQLFVLFILI